MSHKLSYVTVMVICHQFFLFKKLHKFPYSNKGCCKTGHLNIFSLHNFLGGLQYGTLGMCGCVRLPQYMLMLLQLMWGGPLSVIFNFPIYDNYRLRVMIMVIMHVVILDCLHAVIHGHVWKCMDKVRGKMFM